VSVSLQMKKFRPQNTAEEYALYRAALEWDLTDPIFIEKREDLLSESRWRDQMEPYHHQVTNLITFCRRLPVTLLADDVGLGKTISAGLILSELLSRSRISHILIVCPKILAPQWKEELEIKFQIPSRIATGKDLVHRELPEGGALITTYHSARLHLDSIPPDRFQMLILDEAHKLRNLYGVEKPPLVAQRFQQALEAQRFRFVLMLTATPLQNRLWDLYSLVDLLTRARGHQNPFGNEEQFLRKFIADGRTKGRQLRREAQEEFRSIVYSYMSRVRRGEAKLYFPERQVHLHKVLPTPFEFQLIQTLSQTILDLNRLAQISILQALTSSPEALLSQLKTMLQNGSVSLELVQQVEILVSQISVSAKLQGLGKLIERLKQENPKRWRLVIFTGRIETQKSIQHFLEKQHFSVGIINGQSGSRNQQTLKGFRCDPPEYPILISTDAGSEGLNLQVANVLVNYDLPWNPMIVEQRIGRIQRLASEYAKVLIFNLMLEETFEEYIVGRLMEKLQLAAHAIGDIESLIEGAGMASEDESSSSSFDEKIRQLVLTALEGKDIEKATSLLEQSILHAQEELKREEDTINTLLGSSETVQNLQEPRAPLLPPVFRSMSIRDFTLGALENLGVCILPQTPDYYRIEEKGKGELIRFKEQEEKPLKSTLYAPGTASFLQLLRKVTATGLYEIEDLDQNLHPASRSEELVREWTLQFNATFKPILLSEAKISRCFEGIALIRTRVTVAYDSYERLVEIPCSPIEHQMELGKAGLAPLALPLENLRLLGMNLDLVVHSAQKDSAIAEFCRFYLQRRDLEMKAAGSDLRKKKKLEEDFTPRFEMILVAFQGKVYRQIQFKVAYHFDSLFQYETEITTIPYRKELISAPEGDICAYSLKVAPQTCLKRCEILGELVLQHLLASSEISSRMALPQSTVICSLTGKRVLKDEVEVSAVTGNLVARVFLKTSEESRKRAEPEYFGQCKFTKATLLRSELATSEISGRLYTKKQQISSAVSGKTGHREEFIFCSETQKPLAISEAEQCELTQRYVIPGILERCEITQKRVLPHELLRCSVTGKRALKNLFVQSNISGDSVLKESAIVSSTGKYCTPLEAKPCLWRGRDFHVEDLRVCSLTGLAIHFAFIAQTPTPCLKPLLELLYGANKSKDAPRHWDSIALQVASSFQKKHCSVETAVLSPDKQHLAVCLKYRTLLGLRLYYIGLVYSLAKQRILGQIVQGQRFSSGWVESKLDFQDKF
jgi:superfamily II DNA or RNA helicase